MEADGDSDWLHSLKLKHVSSHQSQEIQVHLTSHTLVVLMLSGMLDPTITPL